MINRTLAGRSLVVSLFAYSLLLSLDGRAATLRSVAFAWDPSSSPGVVNYNIYYGQPGGTMSVVAAGNVTTGTVVGLVEGATYHFFVTANNATGVESAASDEVSYTVPPPPAVLQMQVIQPAGGAWALAVTAAGELPPHWTLECSADLQHWARCASGTNMPVNYLVANVAAPQNFYRLMAF